MKAIDFKALKSRLKDYFSLNGFLISQADAETTIREGVSFRGTNILVLIVAIFIASLGLNTNSTAVIIGAMLISPLICLLYTYPSPRDGLLSRMPSSA